MNKNQKNTPYTYSQLIKGNRISAADCLSRAEDSKDGSIKAYWYGLLAELDDDFRRYIMAQAVCGDATVLVR